MNWWRLFVVAVLSLTCCPLLVAAEASGRDIELLPRFPDSTMTDYRQEAAARYELALSDIKKINGVWQIRNKQSLAGNLVRVTYQVGEGHSLAEVVQHFQQALSSYSSEVLFRCDGLDCGSSNEWANRVFREEKLFGPDRSQHYEAHRLLIGEQVYYAVLYMVAKPNQRLFVHIDWLQQTPGEVASETTTVVTDALAHSGQLVLMANTLGSPLYQEQLKALRAFLHADKTPRQLIVVGHAYGRLGHPALLGRSQSYAHQVGEDLKALGFDPKRIEVHGVGALAPVAKVADAKDRVVILLQ